MFFKSKKGATEVSASAAATLIAIIGALIVLYILFLPPEERAELLDDDNGNGYDDGSKDIKLLLSESPKRLLPAEKREFEQDFSPVNIYLGGEGVELKKIETLYSSKSLFKSKIINVSFPVAELNNVKKSLLNFIVAEGQGRLIVELNGYEIFNKEVESGNIAPIDMTGRLRQGMNDLEFSVSSPGAAFWRTNEYFLEDVLIIADVLNPDTQESILSFVVDAEQKENLQKVKLRFLPECKETQTGTLSVSINNFNLYTGVPDCNTYMRPIEFLPERLNDGENRIKFHTSSGWYLIDNIKLTSELKEIVVPIYYFELDSDEIEKVQRNTANVTLYMKFVDDIERKIADITINNHAIRLDQTDLEYNETINSYVERGNNALKISPVEILDIVKLEIMFED